MSKETKQKIILNNKIFIGDNIIFLDKLFKENVKVHCVYIDPPYNTGNKFKYNDKMEITLWENFIEERIIKSKKISYSNTPFIISISEKSLYSILKILNNNFKYVFPPFVWQTKNINNLNKTTNISNICHEYLIVACDENIKSKDEEIEINDNKLKNYEYSIELLKPIENYEYEIIDNKKIYKIDEYNIIKKHTLNSFKNHFFQKRTFQKGHGSERYINLIRKISNYNDKTLYYLDGVKDKNDLGGKFLLNNSYFQSINNNSKMKQKLPSLLGFYQAGINNFQTAKPKELIKRILKVFTNENDIVFDMFGGSGNVCLAINEINRYFYTAEIGQTKEIIKGEFILKQLEKMNKDVFYDI